MKECKYCHHEFDSVSSFGVYCSEFCYSQGNKIYIGFIEDLNDNEFASQEQEHDCYD